MLSDLLAQLSKLIIQIINTFGYFGIALAMFLESALIPLPSEVILPFSGFLVSQGVFRFEWALLASTLGGTLGCLLAYFLGFHGGRRLTHQLVLRFGRFLLINTQEYESLLKKVNDHNHLIGFISRFLPGVRTVISLPLGVARVPLVSFLFWSALGTFLWSLVLLQMGVILGENWDALSPYFRRFDWIIFILGVGLLVFWLARKLKFNRNTQKEA